MRLAGILTVLLPLLLVLGSSPPCHGATARHNITEILAAHPNFTEFSAALTSTGAAAEIDRHSSITVLAVDNAVMAQLKAQKLQPKDLERVTYLHALLDYWDADKLRSIQGGAANSTSLFQALGKAQAGEGMVKITVSGGGRVAFSLSSGASNAPAAAFFQKSIKEVPYDIVVLQVSAPIWSPAPVAAALPPAPAPGSSPSAPAPATAPAHAPPPAPAPASSPADAPAPALAPAVAPAPAIPPTPRHRPAPAPEADTPAASPDADSEPAADDQKNNGARDMASWSLGTAVAAAGPVIVLLLLW